jgi:hypothetical protein
MIFFHIFGVNKINELPVTSNKLTNNLEEKLQVVSGQMWSTNSQFDEAVFETEMCCLWERNLSFINPLKHRVVSHKCETFWTIKTNEITKKRWLHFKEVSDCRPDCKNHWSLSYRAIQRTFNRVKVSLKVCDKGWFITSLLCWTSSTIWSTFSIHMIRKLALLPSSD